MGAPPQPVQAPGAGGPPPNPVGQAASQAQPQTAQMVKQLQSGVQAIAAFTKAIQQVSPQAAADFQQALQLIGSGISKLRGGQPGQATPSGGVPPPGPQAAATPEAT